MEAEEFAGRVFGECLRVASVVLGYNNRFGRGARGDVALLRRVGVRFGFDAEEVPEFRLDGQPISSTLIREAILEGDLDRAERMLGRPFSVLGHVVRGQRLGRELGFPTANLNLHHEVRPPRGVYGCRVRIGEAWHLGLVNIGIRPTIATTSPDPVRRSPRWVDRDRFDRVEVHILDFADDLYGENVLVVFLTRLRGEQKFGSLGELKRQIDHDRESFGLWLRAHAGAVDAAPGAS